MAWKSSLPAVRKMSILIVARRMNPRPRRLEGWRSPLMASQNPWVRRVWAQTTMPSKCVRIILATSFIGSTLERITQLHQHGSMARSTLICLRSQG